MPWGPGYHAGATLGARDAAGITGGFYNNWWRYIVDYDEAIRTLPPPGATFERARTATYGEE